MDIGREIKEVEFEPVGVPNQEPVVTPTPEPVLEPVPA